MEYSLIGSFTFDEIFDLKMKFFKSEDISRRCSSAIFFKILLFDDLYAAGSSVFLEIDCLEKGISTSTKPASQFKRPPLKPLWHKHFQANRHLYRNIMERWGLSNGEGNLDLKRMTLKVAEEFGNDVKIWPGALAHRLVMGGLDERIAAQRMTGDWIIFAKHDNKNYYLDLATHAHPRGDINENALMDNIKGNCVHEFPFLFSES